MDLKTGNIFICLFFRSNDSPVPMCYYYKGEGRGGS